MPGPEWNSESILSAVGSGLLGLLLGSSLGLDTFSSIAVVMASAGIGGMVGGNIIHNMNTPSSPGDRPKPPVNVSSPSAHIQPKQEKSDADKSGTLDNNMAGAIAAFHKPEQPFVSDRLNIHQSPIGPKGPQIG